jgi:hypothetical protein
MRPQGHRITASEHYATVRFAAPDAATVLPGCLMRQRRALGVIGRDVECASALAIIELIAPQGRLALINNEPLELALLMRKSVSIHWESMFTRSMLQTADMTEQHALLDKVAGLVDAGKIRTTVAEHFGIINAANLKRAHTLLETGKARGKIVLEGFPPARRSADS